MKQTMMLVLFALMMAAAAALAEKEQMTGEEAVRLSVQAIDEQLGENALPLTDTRYYETEYTSSLNGTTYRVVFTPKTLEYGKCNTRVYAEDRSVQITRIEKPGYDGDSLYDRFKSVYGSQRGWTQDIWVRFDQMMETLEPKEFDGILLKQTVYPELSVAKISGDEAAEIACRDSGLDREDAIRRVLIDAEPNPVWKFRVLNPERDVDKLVEVDAVTGEIVDTERYKADNYDFDNPIKQFTLHRTYAPAAIEHYGLAYMSAVEVSKRYGDMRLDDPMLPLLDEEEYQVEISNGTVTFRALTKDNDTYCVQYDDGYMVERVEVLR